MRIGQGSSEIVQISDGTNVASVNAAAADALANTLNELVVNSWLQGFNGSTWDRIRSEGTDRDAISASTLGNLQTINFPHAFNGSTWDRVRSLSATSLNGLGQLTATPAVPGASVVKTLVKGTVDDSEDRVTMLTPASGKRIRLLVLTMATISTTLSSFEAYFGTGASVFATVAKAVCYVRLDSDNIPNFQLTWPDGAGPVGAADEVFSIRTGGNITGNGVYHTTYREE